MLVMSTAIGFAKSVPTFGAAAGAGGRKLSNIIHCCASVSHIWLELYGLRRWQL